MVSTKGNDFSQEIYKLSIAAAYLVAGSVSLVGREDPRSALLENID